MGNSCPGKGAKPMFTFPFPFRQRNHDAAAHQWWDQIGLRQSHMLGLDEEASAILRSHQPVGFQDPNGQIVSLAEFTIRINQHIEHVRAQEEKCRERRLCESLQAGDTAIDIAYTRDDAAEVIASGAWAGFASADAIAWSWNMFQFEARHVGAVAHKRQLYYERFDRFLQGELPEYFGFAELARSYVQTGGLTPRAYRHMKKVLGAAPAI